MDFLLENNEVQLEGVVDSEPILSHEIYGEVFYKFYILVSRLSECVDRILITASERILKSINLLKGASIQIEGQYRSYNNYSGEGSKLILTVFAKNIYPMTKTLLSPNYIYLNGYVCKEPTYRTTPFGREIADILLAVNRHYGKSDYIPCIAWGRNAKYCADLAVGTNLKVWGRIQSRGYKKKIEDDLYEERIAYEVSISKLELIENKRDE